MATYAPNQLHAVPLAELQPDPTQPRKYMDPLALEELTASVGDPGRMPPGSHRIEKRAGRDRPEETGPEHGD
jgi:ParB family chromosome partitioning protein